MGNNNILKKSKMKIYLSVIALIVSAFPVKLFADSTNSLLTGMTPSNYVLPTGWELVRTQNFETGSLPSDELGFGTITTTSPHSGNRSLQGRVWKDDSATGWKLAQGVATKGELYLSWYEYMEGQGRMNDEMWLMKIGKTWTSGGQGERWQWLNKLGDWNKAFNILDGNLIFFCEGTQPGTTGSVAYYNDAVWRSVGFGKWQQWEVYWKSNTPGVKDGITQIYLDGVKVAEVTNTAFSGTLDMTGPSIVLGGTTYTKIIWGPQPKPSTTCATTVQQLSYSINRPQDFAQPCLCPGQCPPDGYVPIFNRFVDDIIILQKGSSTHLENNKIISVKLFPNPAGTTLSVSLEQGVGSQGTIELCTLQGTRLYQTSQEVSFPHQVNVSSYAPGVYLVKVVSNGENFTQKVIIN